jgi:signal transduction histidine kinase
VGGTLHRGPLWVAVDAADLVDALDALLDNVFAHTPDGTDFSVDLGPGAAGGARVEVADAGPGLPSGEFAERGRSGAGSSGLGTDIARRVAVASGGGLELGRSAAGGASVVLVLGPAAT